MNYNKRFQNLQSRKHGDFTKDISMENFSESVSKSELISSKLLRYIVGAMEPVSDEYTKNTYKEGERIKNHLENELSNIKFEYQGSVTNNTHIMRYSDIDLLTICDKFYTYKKSIPELDGYGGQSYKGNPENDLRELRENCITILSSNFSAIEIDTTGSKSIGLSGGSLKRKIDVVPSNFYHTEEYKKTKEKCYLGIQVYDKDKHVRILNTPFYHNELLRIKDFNTNGNFKRVVRFIKTLKVDSDSNIEISSYDLTAIAYNMKDDLLKTENKPLLLLNNISEYINGLLQNTTYLKSLDVPDGSRKIIRSDKDISDLNILKNDIDQIISDLNNELFTQKVSSEQVIYTYIYG